MHPSSHALTYAFLPLYFFIDTNTQQHFKNIHTKKSSFPSLPGLPRMLQAAHCFVCQCDGFATNVLCVPCEVCVSKPFYLLLYFCTKLCECKATFPVAAKEQAKINKNNKFYRLYCFSWSGMNRGSSFYIAIYFVWSNINYCVF